MLRTRDRQKRPQSGSATLSDLILTHSLYYPQSNNPSGCFSEEPSPFLGPLLTSQASLASSVRQLSSLSESISDHSFVVPHWDVRPKRAGQVPTLTAVSQPQARAWLTQDLTKYLWKGRNEKEKKAGRQYP